MFFSSLYMNFIFYTFVPCFFFTLWFFTISHYEDEHFFGQGLHVLSRQRYICAHYSYLFRQEYPIKQILAIFFKWEDNQLFALFLVVRRLSDRYCWQIFIRRFLMQRIWGHFLI